MAHSHDTNQVSLRKLVFTIFLNLFITAAQIVGGIVSGSLFEMVRKILHDEFDVEHVTIQFEYGGSQKNGCEC